MTGDNVAGILNTGSALPHGLEEVSENAHDMHESGHHKAVNHGETHKTGPVDDGTGKDRDGNIAYERKRGGGGGTYYVGTCSPRTIGSWLARTLPEPISGFSSQMLTKPDEIKAAAARWGDYWREYATAFYEWRQSHPYSKRENFRFETHKVYHHREESPTFADDGTGDD